MSPSRMRPRFFDTSNLPMMEAEAFGEDFAKLQRDIMFHIGDLARFSEAKWPEEHYQIWPPWVSPGMVQRAAGVARAYPTEAERQIEATYSQYMQVAGKPDRQKLLEEMVDKGQTTDESRQALQQEKAKQTAADEALVATRWLLAVDVNYYLHRFWYSGAGVEAAKQVCDWVGRTVERLKEKGLTDCACCFDGPNNFRKALTKEWVDRYKPRPPKETELIQQLQLVKELLHDANFRCVTVDTFEADDLMASYAIQFDGRITILTQDKDLKQCLSATCNMLLDVEWTEDPASSEMLPEYHWYSAGPSKTLRDLRQKRAALPDGHEAVPKLDAEIAKATHPNLLDDTGLRPDQWADYQAIWGDNVDGIKGAPGLGEKGAKDLIIEFGTLDAVIQAVWEQYVREADPWHPTWIPGRHRIKPKKREALLQLAERLDVVRQLVTLRSDCRIPMDTRI